MFDDRAVLGVYQHHRAQSAGGLQHRDDLLVVKAHGFEISHVDLEAWNPFLAHTSFNPLRSLHTPPSNRHVQSVVGHRLLCFFAPGSQRLEKVLATFRMDKVDDGRRTTGEGRSGTALEIVRRNRSGDRQLQVDVGVDATREDQQSTGVDLLLTDIRVQSFVQFDDAALATSDISPPAPLRSDDLSVSDEDAHRHLSPGRSCPERSVRDSSSPKSHVY